MNTLNKIYTAVILVSIGFVVYSCANKGQGPTGGPKDETPPNITKSSPLNGALNFKKKEILIHFDENISIEKASDNVLISPPQLKQPEVRGNARLVTVRFEDDLIDSTTYTINFGNAIVDLNEKNPLKDYRFSFSTGNEIDTLKISGQLINAADLNPVSGVIVGIYPDGDENLFFSKPFLRIGRSDENGHFLIDNIRAGKYKIFALADANKDFYFQPGEGVAFSDSVFIPTVSIEEMRDTVWEDSLIIDSIRTYQGNRFLPDNVLLRFFKENKKRQYLVKTERTQDHLFKMFFNNTLTELPDIKPLNFDWEGGYIIQQNNSLDSISYWLTDSSLIKTDTLEMVVNYLKTDSVFNLVPQSDTISVFVRKPKTTNRNRGSQSTPATVHYKLSSNASNSFDVYNPLYFRFDAPLHNFDIEKIQLSEKVDSVLKPLKFDWAPHDSTKMIYALKYKWEPEKSYEINVDSAAFTSIYNLTTNKFKAQMKIKSLDEYSSLRFATEPYDSLVVFQLLNTKDIVIQTKPATESGTLFEYLKPGDYYVRAFIDKNTNGIWDTGNVETRTQPEEVYYYHKKLTLRANWEFEESWRINEMPLLQQKPAELKKDGAKATK
ncbi:MAG: Ig-like domain-containing protein [Paludibacteraceae bacterium]|nr:Ig-like domain-containing protein [Paludibacteraceae bacterium]